MKRFVFVGASLTGNKGAAGMVIAPLQNLSNRYPESQFTLLSYFPEDDRKINTYENLKIESGTPLGLIWLFLVVCFAQVCRFCRLPASFIKKNGAFNAVNECHLFLDAGGVCFVDGREKFIPFNILWILAPLILKKPVVKIPQALGPFQNSMNRLAARIFLPRIDLICARGGRTYNYLKELCLENIIEFPDICFSLKNDEINEENIYNYLPENKGRKVIGISPSQVVLSKCQKDGIEYVEILAQFIDRLIQEGYLVVLLPHSIREGSKKTRNNDMPVLLEVLSKVKAKEEVTLIQKELNPSQLRVIIGEFDVFVASRFHAMIAALCMKTPTLVFGWSHKYQEVLSQFDLEMTTLDYSQLTVGTLYDNFKKIEEDSSLIKDKIAKNLPRVKDWSKDFYSQVNQYIL